MPEVNETPDAPVSVKTLVDSHLNSSLVLDKGRLGVMAALTIFLPLAFHAQGSGFFGGLLKSAVLWCASFLVLRFLGRRFHDLRAGQAAARIDRRVPRDHPGREETIQWIKDRNDGRSLNTLLEQLGAPFSKPFVFSSPAAGTQVYSYTTNETKVLQDGKWVTVHSSTSGDGDGPTADEALEQALAMFQQMKGGAIDVASEPQPTPPPGFEPIPIGGGDKKKEKKAKRRRRRSGPRHMPLELDAFDPDEEVEETTGEPAGAGRGGSER